VALTITDTEITSSDVGETASLRDGLWFVTGWPGRAMDRNQAITAMTIARQPRSRAAAMSNPPGATITLVQHARPAQNYGPGKEPQSVRDAWDAHQHSQHEAEPEPEAG